MAGCGSAQLDDLALEQERRAQRENSIVHFVDCDLDPDIERGYSITGDGAKHRKAGMIELQLRDDRLYGNGVEIVLYSLPGPRDSSVAAARELGEELADKNVMNACLRDYLLKHMELIPKSWLSGTEHSLTIFFWGTIFRASAGVPLLHEGDLYVPELSMSYGDAYEGAVEPCWHTTGGVRAAFYQRILLSPVVIQAT